MAFKKKLVPPNPVVWSGKTTASECNYRKPKNAFRKVWFFDVQWSDCPVEVKEQVKERWRELELGNDCYIFKTTRADLYYDKHYLILQFLLEKEPNLGNDEQIIVHYWW